MVFFRGFPPAAFQAFSASFIARYAAPRSVIPFFDGRFCTVRLNSSPIRSTRSSAVSLLASASCASALSSATLAANSCGVKSAKLSAGNGGSCRLSENTTDGNFCSAGRASLPLSLTGLRLLLFPEAVRPSNERPIGLSKLITLLDSVLGNRKWNFIAACARRRALDLYCGRRTPWAQNQAFLLATNCSYVSGKTTGSGKFEGGTPQAPAKGSGRTSSRYKFAIGCTKPAC